MIINGLLPIGTVVLLKDSIKRVMIIGVCQGTDAPEGRKIYDYVGCVYPEGYLSATQNFLFNQEQIEKLFFIGFQDAEGLSFTDRANTLLAQLKAGAGIDNK